MDVAPKKKTTPREKIAQIVRMLAASERGVRVNAWRALERTMESEGISFSDIGNWIEHSYSEDEMLEIVAAVRKEEHARAPQSNGHFVLPEPSEMADFCHTQRTQLKDDTQRRFIDEMVFKTHNQIRLQPGTLGFLASLYIKHGGKI